MHEFAMGATSSYSHYGPVRNPWETNRIAGGSSGGSAAAVAASLAPGTLGTDTRGSVRIPSSLCGIVGLKPTYGLVSRFGVITLSWSLDHVGPIARTVEDVAILLQVIAGYDPKDPITTARNLPDYRAAALQGVKGMKIGIPINFFFRRLDVEVEKAVKQAIDVLGKLGAKIEEVIIPNIEVSPVAGELISPVEAFAFHEKYFRQRPDAYQLNVRQRLLSGSLVLAVDYVRAQQFRNILRRQVIKLMKEKDALVMPSVPIPACEIGEEYIFCGAKKEEIISLLPLYTTPWNLTGQPAISVPCGFSSSNLPIGLQIVGRPFDESTIIRIANSYQKNTHWHEKTPII
jgi:aspartyl-tRNA(Asn)/glutamyl-tRNA(Gln) amidotransferase subunit A